MSLPLLYVTLSYYGNVNTSEEYRRYTNALPLLLILANEFRLLKLDNKVINFIGEYSFDIYLWEYFLMKFGNRLFGVLKYTVIIYPILIAFIVIIAVAYRRIVIESVLVLFDKKKREK